MQDTKENSEISARFDHSTLKAFSGRRRKQTYVIFTLIFIAIAWFVPWVPLLKFSTVTVTQYENKRGEVKKTVGPGEPGWIKIKGVSRHVLNAIIVAEDSRFRSHFGLDFYEIQKSYELNRKKKRFARGGSTITQQVVKMAFLTREKSIVRKAREAVGALFLEAIMSKDEILEWYINMTEFGDGIYGIKAAAQHYFKTKPELLTIEQGVHLALVIPSPNAWSAGLRRRNLTNFGERRFAAIVTNMRRQGFITESLWNTALARGNFGQPLASYQARIREEQKVMAACPNLTDSKCSQSEAGIWEDSPEDELLDAEPLILTPETNLDLSKNPLPLPTTEPSPDPSEETTPEKKSAEKLEEPAEADEVPDL